VPPYPPPMAHLAQSALQCRLLCALWIARTRLKYTRLQLTSLFTDVSVRSNNTICMNVVKMLCGDGVAKPATVNRPSKYSVDNSVITGAGVSALSYTSVQVYSCSSFDMIILSKHRVVGSGGVASLFHKPAHHCHNRVKES